jgi:hypothetical protein
MTNGKDATSELTTYSKTTASIITDLQTICAVVGRVESRKKWGIIDRGEGLVNTAFVEPEFEGED